MKPGATSKKSQYTKRKNEDERSLIQKKEMMINVNSIVIKFYVKTITKIYQH